MSWKFWTQGVHLLSSIRSRVVPRGDRSRSRWPADSAIVDGELSSVGVGEWAPGLGAVWLAGGSTGLRLGDHLGSSPGSVGLGQSEDLRRDLCDLPGRFGNQ